MNGSGMMYGAKNPMTRSNTPPAKIFPKSRKAKENIFENSLMSSRIPVNARMGLRTSIIFKMNCHGPSIHIDIPWVNMTEMVPSASVVERSELGDLNKESVPSGV